MEKTGSVNYRERSGRTVSIPRLDRVLSLHDRRLTSPRLKREWKVKSGGSKTVRKRLRKVELHGCVARWKPLLTERHAKERRNWTRSDWYKVVWSDESKFSSDRWVYTRRRVGEEFLLECVQQTVSMGWVGNDVGVYFT